MRRGFTFIETLLYTALVIIIMSAFVFLTQTIITARERGRAALALQEQTRHGLYRIADTIRSAEDITYPTDGSANNIILEMTDSSRNPTGIGIDSGTILLTEGSSGGGTLTAQEINVTNLTFRRFSGRTPAVEIILEAETRGAASAFRASVSLRTIASVRR